MPGRPTALPWQVETPAVPVGMVPLSVMAAPEEAPQREEGAAAHPGEQQIPRGKMEEPAARILAKAGMAPTGERVGLPDLAMEMGTAVPLLVAAVAEATAAPDGVAVPGMQAAAAGIRPEIIPQGRTQLVKR